MTLYIFPHIILAELSNGPSKKRGSPGDMQSIESAREFFTPDENQRGKRSRAEVRADSKQKKQEVTAAKRHEELLQSVNNSNQIDAFNSALLARKMRIEDLKELIADTDDEEEKKQYVTELRELRRHALAPPPTIAQYMNPETATTPSTSRTSDSPVSNFTMV